ncbi:ribonuclease E/G [Frisingicoccus sp.]|uniref:ribonuclease E/G n=1 Tax=Frisingicoccus sp. TaxID=1918627 RepID=UPI002A82C6D6|nr:ribonuclease E/G [Frisingicoccus sp.]MDY4922839.1 ribonuclease E/G [Frisingicoccus sp.]
MAKEVIITNYKKQHLIVSMEDGKAVEIFLKSQDELEIGDIFIGKVKNIVDNIQAAFVEILPGVIGYYSLKSNRNHLYAGTERKKLCVGDEILVQVERGGIKTKSFVLTSKIQLQGENIVFLGNQHFIGISKKITSDAVRDSIRELGQGLIGDAHKGIIFRTSAAKVSQEQIVEEYHLFEVYYNNIMSTYKKLTCCSRVYLRPRNWLNYVHVSEGDDVRVVTDLPDIYDSVRELYGVSDRIQYDFYEDPSYPLMKLKSLETLIERVISKRVWLRSGASLVIETTEALTSIDVNTSKAEMHKKDEETFFRINLEAAREICRQIRLRNLSGIIIVDFINLSDREHEEQLLSELAKEARKDPVQVNVIDMTPLGLVEMTRKRTYRPFYEQIREVASYE